MEADLLKAREQLETKDSNNAAGAAVRIAEERGTGLDGLTLEDYRGLDPNFDDDVFGSMTVEAALSSKNSVGGTAPERVRKEIEGLRSRVQACRTEGVHGD